VLFLEDKFFENNLQWAWDPFQQWLKMQGHLGNNLNPDLVLGWEFLLYVMAWKLANFQNCTSDGSFHFFSNGKPKMIPFLLIFMGDNVFPHPAHLFISLQL
jgi:hypothetical protein